MAFHVAAQNVFNEWIGEEDLKEGESFGNLDLYGPFEKLESLPLEILGEDWENELDKRLCRLVAEAQGSQGRSKEGGPATIIGAIRTRQSKKSGRCQNVEGKRL